MWNVVIAFGSLVLLTGAALFFVCLPEILDYRTRHQSKAVEPETESDESSLGGTALVEARKAPEQQVVRARVPARPMHFPERRLAREAKILVNEVEEFLAEQFEE